MAFWGKNPRCLINRSIIAFLRQSRVSIVSSESGVTSCSSRAPECELSGDPCGIAIYVEQVVRAHENTWRLDRNLTVTGTLVTLTGKAARGSVAKLFMPNGMVVATEADKRCRFVFKLEAAEKSRRKATRNLRTINIRHGRSHSYVPIFVYPDG